MQEFKNSVKEVGYKDIFKIPLPDSVKNWYVSGTELYGVRGIEVEEFEGLNKTIVRKLPKGMIVKQRVIDKVSRSFKRDEDGNYIKQDYRTPTGSIVVISNTNLKLPYSWWVSPKDGYGYVDFNITSDGEKEYIYVLPRSVLYRVNQTALVISVKDMKNFSGMGYKTWRNGKIFLHVIPYNPNSSYTGSKVLKTGYSLNYDNEISEIVTYWQKSGVIPEIVLCELEDGTNLCLKQTTVGYDEYEPIEMLPLSDKEVYGEES